jgi:hypothetical protein
MKVLHVYPKTDEMVAQHVTQLMEGMQLSAEVQAVSNLVDFKNVCKSFGPDIVHCHGCWQYGVVNAGNFARRQGARIVLSPHGQLEPWVLEEKPLQEKFHKTALWQKPFVQKAYALISFGKMEQQYLAQLKWNPRIEMIHNAVITNSTTRERMCAQTFAVYQKVLDSNVLEQMDDATQQLMATIIKAGILGDKHWTEFNLPETIDWRRMLIYAEHQNIRNYVDYGINILGLSAIGLDTENLPAYFPESYQRPQPIKKLIGEYKGDETDYLVRMIRQIEKQPLLLHLIELTRELYRDTVNDDALQEALEEKGLMKFAARLMPVLSELTLLNEGYMPVDPINDRGTRKIRESITNHLKI